MSLRNFIRQHREEIDHIIRSTCLIDMGEKINNSERESWIKNDEGLYNWARSEGWPG